MKIVLMTIVAVLMSNAHNSQAMAGTGNCPNNLVLTCQTTYHLMSGGTVPGPTGDAHYEDTQVEPFDPMDCQATVALYTVAGKLVTAAFLTKIPFQAWLENHGTAVNLKPVSAPDNRGASLILDAGGAADVTSIDLSCHIFDED